MTRWGARRGGEFRSRYGRWALVVGGSEGIGAEYAVALAEKGLDLLLVARRREPLDELSARLRAEHGVAVTPLAIDAGAHDAVPDIAGATEGLDLGLLVCSAAFAPVQPFLEMPAGDLDRMLDLNCRLATGLGHLVGRRLVERGRGGMIFMSSMAGTTGSARIVQYAATKAYLRVLAEGLWAELAPRGVDVLACCPGQVHTPTFDGSQPRPPGRMAPPVMEPGSVARAALAALGRQPVLVPGRLNRVAAFANQRLLPKRSAIDLISTATRRMYP